MAAQIFDAISEAVSVIPNILWLLISNNLENNQELTGNESDLADGPLELSAKRPKNGINSSTSEPISESDFSCLLDLIKEGKCERLELANRKIGDDHIKRLILALENEHSRLRLLDLSGNEITDHGAEMLAGYLMKNNTLQGLKLFDNPISNQGAKVLATKLSDNRCLQILELSKTKITDEGAEALALLLKKNNKIMSIILHKNKINTSITKYIDDQLDERVNVTREQKYHLVRLRYAIAELQSFISKIEMIYQTGAKDKDGLQREFDELSGIWTFEIKKMLDLGSQTKKPSIIVKMLQEKWSVLIKLYDSKIKKLIGTEVLKKQSKKNQVHRFNNEILENNNAIQRQLEEVRKDNEELRKKVEQALKEREALMKSNEELMRNSVLYQEQANRLVQDSKDKIEESEFRKQQIEQMNKLQDELSEKIQVLEQKSVKRINMHWRRMKHWKMLINN